MKDNIKIKLRAERNLPRNVALLRIYGRKGATLREINRAVKHVGGREAFADRRVEATRQERTRRDCSRRSARSPTRAEDVSSRRLSGS